MPNPEPMTDVEIRIFPEQLCAAKPVFEDAPAHSTDLLSTAFSPDGKFLASSSWNRAVRRHLIPIDEAQKLAEEYRHETH